MKYKIILLSTLAFASCKQEFQKSPSPDKDSNDQSGMTPPRTTPGNPEQPEEPINSPIPPTTTPPPAVTPPIGTTGPSGTGETQDPLRLNLDFAAHPVTFAHLLWMSPLVKTGTEGFKFEIGTGDGQRSNKNGVTWPDQNYYSSVLGSMNELNRWDMRTVILYNEQVGGDWAKNGWRPIQDPAEGAACVDDTARTAIAVIDHYISTGDENSYLYARSLLNWLGYMVTLEGRVYNFVFLDAPKHFQGGGIDQTSNSHYQARLDFKKRWRYPDSSFSSYGNPDADPEGIVSASDKQAPPFRGHPRYSIYMNDLTDINNADVATIYDAPLYDKETGARSGLARGIRTRISTSHMNFNAWTSRNLWAFAKGFSLIQKRLQQKKSLDANDIALARFIENHFNRIARFSIPAADRGMDVKQASVIISALSEYQRAVATSKEFPAYNFKLAEDSGTPYLESDDRLDSSTIDAALNRYVSNLNSRMFRSNDWRNGIFLDNSSSINWVAWGELEIYALASYAQYRFEKGDNSGLGFSALDIATTAAEGFYGKEAFHYRTQEDELRRTRERVTSIRNGAARYHNTPGEAQLNFATSNMTVGLWRLAQAWERSKRSNAIAKRDEFLGDMLLVGSWYIGNNTTFQAMYTGKAGTNPFEGRGAVFDSIGANSGDKYSINRGSGGESNAEGIRAVVVIHDAIQKYKLKSSLIIKK